MLVDQDRCRGWRHVRVRLPVQEGLLQPPHRQGREVHVLLPAHRGRHPDRLLGDLRRPAALHRPDALRRRQGARGGVHRGRPRTSTRRSVGCSSTRTTPRSCAAAEQAGIPRDWIDGRAALPGLRAHQHVPGGAAAAPGVPHHADGLVHPAAVAGRRRRPRHRLRRRGHATTCSPPSTRCASRSSTSPSCSPPATSRRSTPSCASSPRCARYMRDINLGRDPDESIAAAVGMTGEQMYDMYRLLAIAKYEERYVIPPAHAEQAHRLEELATECSLDYDGGPGMGGSGPFGEGSGGTVADRRRELPDAARPADRRHRASPRTTRRAGSTCSTGTARAHRRACSRHAGRTTTPDRHERQTGHEGRGARRRPAATWQVASLLLGYPDEPARRPATGRCAAADRTAARRGRRRRCAGSWTTSRRRRPSTWPGTTSRRSTTSAAAAST